MPKKGNIRKSFKQWCLNGNKSRPLKKLLGFLYGLLLGLGFHELILVDLSFTEMAAFIVGVFISLMLAFGIAFSKQIRCIAVLSVPSFGGRAGRGVLKAVVLAYIIAGPIQNLSNNGKEVVRVFACTTSLTYNLTKTRFELMFKPFTQALFGMKTDVGEIKDIVHSIKDVSAPITGEIEDETEMRKLKEENDYVDEISLQSKSSNEIEKKYASKGEEVEAMRYERQYLKKIEMRCMDQFAKTTMNCRRMFAKTYDKCYDKVSWIAAWLLCWPMKLTFVCNIPEKIGGPSKCDPGKDLDVGFGEGYTYLKNTKSVLSSNFKDVRLQYKLPKFEKFKEIRDATDGVKAVIHAVQHKKEMLDQILTILKRILAFIFLRIIIKAQKYHDKYLRDIEFDNIYITKYFRHIDARRHKQEKVTLLPLKKTERSKLIDPWSLKPLKQEREELLGQTVKLLLELVTATTFILLDRLFYEALDLVRRHARIDYMQTGHHDMMLDVKGVGIIASLLRTVVRGFNIKKRIKTVRSNQTCLPRPTLISNYYLFKIYGTYLAVWFLTILQAYTQRMRRVICASFYRKREKRRVLFLYNETLKKRIGFLRYIKKKVKKLARERRLQEDLNVCAVLRINFPRLCDCLRLFPVARRKCTLCGQPESSLKKEGAFEMCNEPTCRLLYCTECWFDVGRVCYACQEGSSDDESDPEDSEDQGYNEDD